MNINPHDPEFQTVTAFVEMLCDDGCRPSFTRAEAGALALNLSRVECRTLPLSEVKDRIIAFAASCGMTVRMEAPSDKPREVRGFTANPNTKYVGNPGAGGGGGDSLIGFAGREG